MKPETNNHIVIVDCHVVITLDENDCRALKAVLQFGTDAAAAALARLIPISERSGRCQTDLAALTKKLYEHVTPAIYETEEARRAIVDYRKKKLAHAEGLAAEAGRLNETHTTKGGVP